MVLLFIGQNAAAQSFRLTGAYKVETAAKLYSAISAISSTTKERISKLLSYFNKNQLSAWSHVVMNNEDNKTFSGLLNGD